ncbi:MAG: 6-carboxytetrahydropterin synthase QueD, partial [Gammaproteobacteria bacterium]
MISITKIFKFEAAHFLPNHEGKCKNTHGHSYKLEVTIKGIVLTSGPEQGMVIDYGNLSAIIDEHVIQKLDHCLLNDVFHNPTAEYMVWSIAEWLEKPINTSSRQVIKLRLWETDTCYAEWR